MKAAKALYNVEKRGINIQYVNVSCVISLVPLRSDSHRGSRVLRFWSAGRDDCDELPTDCTPREVAFHHSISKDIPHP